MPVTLPIANRPVEAYTPKAWDERSCSNDADVLLSNLPTVHLPARILQSSVDGSQQISVKKNGFVLGVVLAYNGHHNLVIRPDDVWIAILSQLNFYINAHAEELRHKFVDHDGKKNLTVVSSSPTIAGFDFADLTVQMAGEIKKNVKDKSIVPWVLPNFSTTTPNDTVICSALIMSTLKQYFNYVLMGGCGIPFITIEGTQADWQSILMRIEKLPEFGAQPTEWAGMLRVVLKRFVRAFDKGGPQADHQFWERMVHDERGASSRPFLSGWLTAFCAWDNKGVFFEGKGTQKGSREGGAPEWVMNLTFDGVWFPRISVPPEGYAEVDVILKELSGKKWDCTMLAGHVGTSMSGQGGRLDTVHLAPQWFMYHKGEERLPGRGFWYRT